MKALKKDESSVNEAPLFPPEKSAEEVEACT